MSRPIVGILGIVVAAQLAVCSAIKASPLSLDDIQGAWWSSCEDPAAEFVIVNDTYGGDFSGIHPLEIKDDILVFKDGLLDGHGINVSGRPLAFRVIGASHSELVLRPLSMESQGMDWRLLSCKGMPSNNSFKPNPLRGSA